MFSLKKLFPVAWLSKLASFFINWFAVRFSSGIYKAFCGYVSSWAHKTYEKEHNAECRVMNNRSLWDIACVEDNLLKLLCCKAKEKVKLSLMQRGDILPRNNGWCQHVRHDAMPSRWMPPCKWSFIQSLIFSFLPSMRVRSEDKRSCLVREQRWKNKKAFYEYAKQLLVQYVDNRVLRRHSKSGTTVLGAHRLPQVYSTLQGIWLQTSLTTSPCTRCIFFPVCGFLQFKSCNLWLSCLLDVSSSPCNWKMISSIRHRDEKRCLVTSVRQVQVKSRCRYMRLVNLKIFRISR